MESDEKKAENAQKTSLEKKYSGTITLFEEFHKIASLGDLTAIYRNRQCFVNEKRRSGLVKPAIDVFLEFPASRPAVFHYTGLLIHECVHYWFNKKENVQQVATIQIVKEATCQILDFYIKFFSETDGKGGLEECLQWLCELSAELSLKNAGRPAMAHAQQNGEILTILKSNDVVEKMLSLMNMIITSTLNENSNGCMKALFESSRHGQHFSWIWLHIATFLQGTIITHLLESGADQFRIYVAEISSRKTIQTGGPAVLNIIQTEYEHKFRAISDVFNFLMGKRNPELQEAVSQLIVDSLDCKVDKSTSNTRLGFAFFFKLVTCSIKTLQILVNSNCHLITPFNVVRAIRQVQTVDKSIILPTITYTDFIKQIVEEVDPITHGIIFEILIELVYNPHVFEGENVPEMHEKNLQIGQECFPVLDVMMNRIVRIAHSAGGFKCPSQHPAIMLYSSGDKLQFIIDSIGRHIEKSSSIIRHLHAISIAFDEPKAAEIALRFLMTISYKESNYLYILMAYLSATVPFYPTLMTHMWREFSALKLLIEQSFNTDDPEEKMDEFRIHMNILHNTRTLLDWEFSADYSEDVHAFSYWKLYPGQYVGRVLTSILTESNRICWELQAEGKTQEMLTIYRSITKLIEAVCQSNGIYRNEKVVKNGRKILIPLAEMYKLMAQFSIILKSTLMLVGKDLPEGIVIFEELRAQFLYFLFGNHLDPNLTKFSPIFVNFFVTACFIDSKKLFNERIGETMENLIDESGLNKLLENCQTDEGPSVIDSLRSLKMRDSALDMLHSGQLKRRRKNGQSGKEINEDEDAVQRVYVVLDAIRLMCTSGKLEIRIACSKQLAQALVQTICREALMTDMRFDEWDSEAEFIHRHVEIAQRLAHSPFSEGLLRILSETRSFAHCLPIMKSKLAILLNESEKFPDHKSVAEPIRQKLHNWVMLAHKGGLLPTRFVYICDMEQFATCHETYLMLVEIWRFFMFRNISISTIDTYHSELLRGDVDEGLPNEQESIDKVNLSVFRIIIQNHLPDTVPLFPKIFPAEYQQLKLSKD